MRIGRFTGPLSEKFASESALQRHFEKVVLPGLGVSRLLATSLRGGPRIGFVDTLAVDHAGQLFLIEYKWDLVDRHTLDQLASYNIDLRRLSAAADRLTSAARLLTNFSLDTLRSVAVGHRFNLGADVAGSDLTDTLFWRYSYGAQGELCVDVVDHGKVLDGPVGEPAERVDKKRPFLQKYYDSTTPAARAAFDELERRLEADFGDQFTGKDMKFRRKDQIVRVTFSETAMHCAVSTKPAVPDTRGRTNLATTSGYQWVCALTGPEDISYFLRLVGIVDETPL